MRHKSMRRPARLLCFSLAVAFVVLICSGCEQKKTVNTADILTQKEQPEGSTPITVLVKYAFTINNFETAVEEKFPDINIIQVGNYTRDMGIAEYESRMEHGDLPDMVMTWPLEVGEEYWSDRLLDLSSFDFTSRYNLSLLNNISRDGKLYYLPGPSQVRGIVYNETLFEENGWELPQNFEEFVTLCKTIENSGMRSLQLGLGNGEVLDTAFVGYGYADCFSQPQDMQWVKNYNGGEGSFADQFMPALNTFQRLIDEDILRKSDLDITYADREKMLFTRKCAMIEDSVLIARMGESITGTKDSFKLMPFFSPNDGGDWARLYAVCYIGLNKQLIEPQNKEKYQKVLTLMEYISSQEGQLALMGDSGGMLSGLTDMPAPDAPELDALLPALNAGRSGVFPQFKNAQQALRQGLAGMLRGEFSAAEVAVQVDAENINPPQAEASPLLGTANADFTMVETGNFITDCMREKAGSDFALFLDNGKDGRYNGKGVSGNLYRGDVTESDIQRVLPDLKNGESGTMWIASITGADLIQTLEYSIPVNKNDRGWFYYFSGLYMQYDPTAQPGSRIRQISLSDGTKINNQALYTIAVADESVPEEFLVSCDKTNIKISMILEEAVQRQKTISPSKDGRFQIAAKE